MSKHYAKAFWLRDLMQGEGKVTLKSTGYEAGYSFSSRFEASGQGTSPEELIGAAHSGCFSMALAHALATSGFKPNHVKTEAEVTLDKKEDGFRITEILLKTSASVEGISTDKFLEIAGEAKKNCPVSKALTGVEIKLEAQLES